MKGIEKQARALADNLGHVVKGEPLVVYKPDSSREFPPFFFLAG